MAARTGFPKSSTRKAKSSVPSRLSGDEPAYFLTVNGALILVPIVHRPKDPSLSNGYLVPSGRHRSSSGQKITLRGLRPPIAPAPRSFRKMKIIKTPHLGSAGATRKISGFAHCNGLDVTIHNIHNFFKERKQVLHDG
jgi:hypothetical protein